MKKEDIQKKIDVVLSNLEKLSSLKEKTYEDFASDFRNTDSALYRLQNTMQTIFDIGSYITTSLELRTPDTSPEIKGILDEVNRITHLFYRHIDTRTLYDMLSNGLNDIKELYTALLEVIEEDEK